MAAYGPDNTHATKLVVSVVRRSGRTDPDAMQTWTTSSTDVRQDPLIAEDVIRFLRRHGVNDIINPDRIIGCPHEEGIDYPIGRTCPLCPFWAGIDRFTHEPLPAPAPTMTVDDVLQTLSKDLSAPRHEALRSADAHRTALVEPLVDVIDRVVADVYDASGKDLNLFSYALYLLAKWREPRAYPGVVRWLALPEEDPFVAAGDIVTQDGARILASVCNGDLDPIKALILNRSADEYGRSSGVSALALLAAWGEVPIESIAGYFLWLAREGLEREPSYVWDDLAASCADIEALGVFAELRRAYDEGLVDPQCMGRDELDESEAAPPGLQLEKTRARYAPIADVAAATSWWSRDDDDAGDDADDDEVADTSEPREPYRAAPKVGRNAPCPCGSGRKFKKCCGR
jgi:hypothetical protein